LKTAVTDFELFHQIRIRNSEFLFLKMFVPLGTQKTVSFDKEKNVTLIRVKDSAYIYFTEPQWSKLFALSTEITNALEFQHEFVETFLTISDGQEVRVKVYPMTQADEVWLCDIRLIINKIPQPLCGVALTKEQWKDFLDILTCLKKNLPVKGQQEKIGTRGHSESLQELCNAICIDLFCTNILKLSKKECYGCLMNKNSQKHHTCQEEGITEDNVEKYGEKARKHIKIPKATARFMIAHLYVRENLKNQSWPFFLTVAEYKEIVETSLKNLSIMKDLAIKGKFSDDGQFAPMVSAVVGSTKTFFCSA
jgi:hypothetical protein